ncbi:MAG: hypothetical protein H7A18_00005 [Sinobacteraceae bacterium]|nr:hypothetical protein [Nevskiaceae bacterium]
MHAPHARRITESVDGAGTPVEDAVQLRADRIHRVRADLVAEGAVAPEDGEAALGIAEGFGERRRGLRKGRGREGPGKKDGKGETARCLFRDVTRDALAGRR